MTGQTQKVDMLEMDQGLEGISQVVLEDHLSQETEGCLEIENNMLEM